MLYFAHVTRPSDGAIQVTGSHNSPRHNGFKMMRARAPFSGLAFGELAALALKGRYALGGGSREHVRVQDDYLAALLGGFCPGSRGLKVVWDPGNGAAGACIEALCAKLPGEHTVINAPIDGRFPNHHPDPANPATLVQLQDAVRRCGADLGVAFDADGDRLGVVDSTGRVIPADHYLLLLARGVLRRHPGATILADVKCSDLLFESLCEMGAQPVFSRTGHSWIVETMVKTGARLAGEMSGHVFFADAYYGFDDALYAAVRLLREVASMEETLAEWFENLPRRASTPELRIPCADERKAALVEVVRARLRAEGAEVSEVDGVRVRRPEGWWLLRVSCTQAAVVARAEAANPAGLSRLERELYAYLADAQRTVP